MKTPLSRLALLPVFAIMFSLAAITVSSVLQGCTKTASTTIEPELPNKEFLDIVNEYGEQHGLRELSEMTALTIEASLNDVAQREDCVNYPIKRRLLSEEIKYNFDITGLLFHMLPRYGTEAHGPLDPLDTDGDGVIGSTDLITLLGSYGAPLFVAPDPNLVTLVGTELSGGGVMGLYAEDSIVIDGDSFPLLSLFPEYDQNCFLMHTGPGVDGCVQSLRLMFNPIGAPTAYYHYLN